MGTALILPKTGGTGSGSDTTIRSTNVPSQRFVSIGSGTSGSIASSLPTNATILLDKYGGLTDAVLTKIVSGKPTVESAKTAGNVVVGVSLDSAGNWSFSGTPSAYPVAIVYTVRQPLIDYNAADADIWGDAVQEDLIAPSVQTALDAKEASLANPSTDGFVLSSTAAGVRSWVARNTDTITEGVTNLYFTAARALAAITMFTLAKNSSSPNATVPVMSITVSDSATDVDVAIVPKGNGGIALQVADGTATAGNKRGVNSIDLQISRTANTQVANGTNAFCVGARNTASSANAMALGLACQATNTASVAMGNGCVGSGANSFAVGNGNVALGNGGAAFGASSAASGINSLVHGLQGSAFSINSRHVFSSGWHAVAGDAQFSRWRVKAATTDATPTVMTVDGGGATSTTRINLQVNNVYYFKGQILGKQTAVGVATGVGCWTFSGMVMTGTTAASIILVGTPTITAVSNTGTWGTPTITVDTTNGALILTVTGKAATTIRWGATIETEEIIYA